MIINYINNKARILNRFGNGWLIKKADGKHELVDGRPFSIKATKLARWPLTRVRFGSLTISAKENHPPFS